MTRRHSILRIAAAAAIVFAAPAARAQGINPAAAAAPAPAPDPGVGPEVIDMLADAVIAKLKARPELLLDIILTYEERNRSGQAMIRPEDPVSGTVDGDVTLVEFFDPSCLPCRATAAEVDAVVAADRRIKAVHKDFPTTKDGLALSLDALGGSYAEARKAILAGRAPAPADDAGRARATRILSANREAATRSKVTVLPTLFLVAGGRVERVEGVVTAAELAARVAALRKGQSAAK